MGFIREILYRKLPKKGNSFTSGKFCDRITILFQNIPYKDNPMLNLIKEPIQGYEDIYWVDNLGNVYNARKRLKTYFTREGYECLKLTKDGVRSSPTVHRLVATTFIPNPDNKEEINHIDGDKSNNRVDNLEWCTSSENKRHALDTGLKIYNKPTTGLKMGKGSRYHNVSYDKSRNKWMANIRVDNKSYGQKRFNTEEEAARHVDATIDLYKLDRPKNFN